MTATHDLLLEIGCEEIPSRFIPGAMEQLDKGAAALLKENGLGYKEIETYATPRRLVVLVKDLESEQEDVVEKVKGPPLDRAYDDDGKPTMALQGFIKNQGVSLEQVEKEIIKGARYVVACREIPGKQTEELLPDLLPQLIRKLSFPRPMYWQSKEVRFARPIRWLLALYNEKPVTFKFAGIESGKATYGHRFLAPGPFEINSVEHFFSCLDENYIVLDHNRRREMICTQLEQKAAEKGGVALIDDDLLEEVTFLVEYPVAVDGSFDQAYLDLPQEVTITSMQYHQRYFPIVEKESGRLMPYFVGISNNRFHPNIRKGYAKVLQARLADGRFFFNEDRKEPLENYVSKLKSVIFLESLGNLDQKRSRLVDLTGKLSEVLDLPADKVEKARRIAHLCKADLVTSMVKEFPELQGVMGREYARLNGEEQAVALGIYEHYLPRYPGDHLPSDLEAALVSLADRIDTLAGCFAVGIQPTGSQDPYGLRRQAQGAIYILLGLKIDLALKDLVGYALDLLSPGLNLDTEQRQKLEFSLHEFLVQRIRFAFQERGMAHDVLEAVLAVPFANISELFNRVAVLEEYLQGPLLDDVIIAYNRVANLAKKAAGNDPDQALLTDPAEKELYRKLQEVESEITGEISPDHRLKKLQSLKLPIDNFFDNVMVMVEDERVRENRLNMLASIKSLFNRLADFSKLRAP